MYTLPVRTLGNMIGFLDVPRSTKSFIRIIDSSPHYHPFKDCEQKWGTSHIGFRLLGGRRAWGSADPKPQTPNSKPQPQNPYTLKPSNPKSLNPNAQTLNPKPQTPQPPTRNFVLSSTAADVLAALGLAACVVVEVPVLFFWV